MKIISIAACKSTDEQPQRDADTCQRGRDAPDVVLDIAHPLQQPHDTQQAHPLEAAPMTCTICFGSQPAAAMHRLAGCGRSFCRACLQTYATVAIGLRSVPITCAHPVRVCNVSDAAILCRCPRPAVLLPLIA